VDPVEDNFYFWILHPVACIIRIVGNTVPGTIPTAIRFIIPSCRYMFRSLCDHLQEDYTILVFGNYYINNGSVF
jgi:hypothetical protein